MATQVWAWQGGSSAIDRFNAVAMGSEGSTVSAGFSNGTANVYAAPGSYWTAVKLDVDGTVLWEWENISTTYTNDKVEGAAMAQDGSVVLAGSGGGGFQVINLDANGSFLWQFEDGSASSDGANGIAMGDDGAVVVAGVTYGDWNISALGSGDMAAFKLDAGGNLLWKWQGGTSKFDAAHAVAMAEDGSVVIAGRSSGDFVGIDSGVSSSSSSLMDVDDSAAIKLDAQGSEIWKWQGETSSENVMTSVAATEDGSFVMAGYTSGVWSGEAGLGGYDFAAVRLGADGNEVWRWQDGTVGEDKLFAVAVQTDGTIVLGGRTQGDWSGSNAGFSDFAVVALDIDGEEIWRWQGGSPAAGDETGFDSVYAMAAGTDGRVILTGRSYGSWEEASLGQADYMVVMLDTGEMASSSPTAAPSPMVMNESPPAPTSTPSQAPTTATPTGTTQAPGTLTTSTPSSAETPASNPPLISPTPPSFSTSSPLAAPTPDIGSSSAKATSRSTLILAGVASAAVGAALVGVGVWLRKRHFANSNEFLRRAPRDVVVDDGGRSPPPPQLNNWSPLSPDSHVLETVAPENLDGGGGGIVFKRPAPFPPAVQPGRESATNDGKGGRFGAVAMEQGDTEPIRHPGKDGGGSAAFTEEDDEGCSADPALTVTTPTAFTLVGERDNLTQAYREGGAGGDVLPADDLELALDGIRASSSTTVRKSSGGPGFGHAVAVAADDLARHCHIPGVSEAAAAVSILVHLVIDNRDNKKGTEASLKRCRSIITLLQRVSRVLGKGGDTNTKAEREMLGDVHDAVFDLVELVKTYQSKNALSQLLMSTLFRRRQDEMGAVVDRAIFGLQVQVGCDVNTVKLGVSTIKGSIEEAQSKCLAEARKARRQRKLDQLEIPTDHVTITDELLGKGGFGEVYLADYNGRNAAVKILHIDYNPNRLGANDLPGRSTGGRLKTQNETSQRKAFLLELHAMIRLRSPHTVNVYGAVTSLQDRLVLVMELLAGGDLRTLLKNAVESLPEDQARQIIGDICAGMAFLHSKETVHGDLKSANVLLDGAGRAKIGDFGTSRWTQHTMSTGLATFTTKSSQNTQMSLAWSAPEVLDSAGSTFESDVYNFGIVVWEVLSRDLPWAAVTHPRDIYILVALKGLRPDIPDDAPTQIADVARACWAVEPSDRPTFCDIMQGMKTNGRNV